MIESPSANVTLLFHISAFFCNFVTQMLILFTLIAYFLCLLVFSRWTARRATNETFYRGNRRSPWYMVAFGMVGASISGITFVSVPGMVMKTDMTYVQTCLGFIVGYFLVAFHLSGFHCRLFPGGIPVITCLLPPEPDHHLQLPERPSGAAFL